MKVRTFPLHVLFCCLLIGCTRGATPDTRPSIAPPPAQSASEPVLPPTSASGQDASISIEILSVGKTYPTEVGLRIRNQGRGEVHFLGYKPADPCYVLQTWEANEWRPYPLGCSKAGILTFNLRRKGVRDLRVELPPLVHSGLVRIGIECFSNRPGEGSVAWSPGFTVVVQPTPPN